ncbi:MAG: hypothetical protein Ta2B_20020 [Termitinemataceae bacterium]|nr:MAG: hypothetical protein Ta2B_20020 [Termitinemataceae bacterium]
MTKKQFSFLFIGAATLFNIITTVLFFLLLFLLYFSFLRPFISSNYIIWGIPVIFILSILFSFFLYGRLIKIFFKKVDLNKYFDPLLGVFDRKGVVGQKENADQKDKNETALK